MQTRAMTNRHVSDAGSFHAPHPGPAPRRYRRGVIVAACLAGFVLCAGLVVGVGAAALYAFDPLGDEWICSQGEAPAGNSCYPEGETLPPGVSWDPLGNRPMPYNCDKDGWVSIARDVVEGSDCIREGAAVPEGWHVVSS